MTDVPPIDDLWWKSAVVYQIYLRSFYDTNADGIGDLPGVVAKLDYLCSLGVTAVWLTPFNTSPDEDNGYDVADYYGVDPRYGSLADFDRLVAGCHERGMRLIMDMVVDFTSDQHPWFVDSRSSRDSAFRDFYFWRGGRNGGEPNNWSAGFAPSAWAFDAPSGEYFLHYYSARMPDLNWDNPVVRANLCEMMRWWLERGVDGLRLDSINLIKKNTAFPDARTPDPVSPGYFYDVDLIYNQPGLIDLLQQIRKEVLEPYGAMAIGETSVTDAQTAASFVKPESAALDMVFNFEPVEMPSLDLLRLKEINRRWYDIVRQEGWISHYLSNHDQPRQVSKFGDEAWRVKSAKALALMLHTLPGTPFVYQGEEIGMTNCRFDRIDDYDDIATHNRYRGLLESGWDKRSALAAIQETSRDNARTPMQWTESRTAGFTDGTPWLTVNRNCATINVADALADPGSPLHFYRHLIQLRKAHPIMVHGDFHDLLPDHRQLYIYQRRLDTVVWTIVMNLCSQPLEESLPLDLEGHVLISNYKGQLPRGRRLYLEPWDAILLSNTDN